VTGFCEHGNERLGSIDGGEFLDQLSHCWLLKDFFVLSYLPYFCAVENAVYNVSNLNEAVTFSLNAIQKSC
jgi:hypothetical protein